MNGYVIHHSSKLWDGGVRADLYRNDPYVWATPFLWTFCHTNQRPRVQPGMPILWISKDDHKRFVCDLVFVVGEVLTFAEGLTRFLGADRGIALDHFVPGITHHYPYVQASHAKTYVADMSRSFIPHPAVDLEADIDGVRRGIWSGYKPIRKAWARPSTPLHIPDIEPLLALVESRAKERIKQPLPVGSWVPGRGEPLK